MASGNKITIPERVREIAGSLCDSLEMELVHVEFLSESGRMVLRVYIDKPGGVTLDDCAGVSRELGDILDVELEDNIRYNLEVSSPGINRPLTREKDFERFKGKRAKIKVKAPVDGQKNFTGLLLGISDGVIKLETDKGEVDIPFQGVAKARLANENGDN